MPTTVESVLAAKNLIGLIQGIVAGVPDDIMPAGMLESNETVEGNRGSYFKVEGNRQLARIVQYGAPSKRRELQGVSEVPVTLLHTFEHQNHPAATLMNLMAEDSPGKQQRGQQSVARQVQNFGTYFRNLRISAAHMALFKGEMHFDADGNMLSSSSGAQFSVNYGVPAGNKDQLNVLGDGDILDADWDVATTKIAEQIKALKVAARKLTGYPLMNAFYGEKIFDYLMMNNQLRGLVENNQGMNAQAASGEIPNGLMGLNWRPAYGTWWKDAGGSFVDVVGPDDIVFTPDPSPDWWDFINGTYLVPNQLNIGMDASAMLGSLTEEAGAFSYAEMTTDPPGIKHYAGDTFLPVLKVPGAIFTATVPTTGS